MTRLRELHIAVADSGIVDAIEAASADEVLSIRVLDLNFEEADTIGFSSSLTHLTPFLSTLKLCYCVFGDDDSFTSLLDHLEHLRSLILENVTGLTASAIRIALSHHIERLWSLSIENIQVRLPTVGWLDNVLHRFKVLYRLSIVYNSPITPISGSGMRNLPDTIIALAIRSTGAEPLTIESSSAVYAIFSKPHLRYFTLDGDLSSADRSAVAEACAKRALDHYDWNGMDERIALLEEPTFT